MYETKELQIKDKQAAVVPAAGNGTGLVFKPEVDILETARAITLLVDMPGVAADGVNINLRDGVLTLDGNVRPWEAPGASDVLVEFAIGKYYRQFSLPEHIDQDKIEAKLEDGVLKLHLPKLEKAQPRQITVHSV